MPSRLAIVLMFLFMGVAAVHLSAAPPLPARVPTAKVGSVILSPCHLKSGLKGQEGWIVVPENRSAKASRPIAVHFLRFSAREPGKNLPPLFVLPGGPGGVHDKRLIDRMARSDRYNSVTEVQRYNRFRDVVMVNQRGNARGPDQLSKQLVFFHQSGSYDQPRDFKVMSARLAEGMKQAIDLWQSNGMDLAGYDIINMVDDVDDIRRALGYEKIALRGNSFGSQWSLAYMKRWPQHVDRALLAGVEPLDHGYDSPQGIWNVLQRLEAMVIAEGKVSLPKEGLLGALKAIVERLEGEAVVVSVQHPQQKTNHEVAFGVDDFRTYVNYRTKLSLRQSLAAWPKFILEIYHEDYDYLASQLVQHRRSTGGGIMLDKLVNNSLGISDAREEKLEAEPARRWLGDINWTFKATRDVTPTPEVDDEFRKFAVSEIPVLMVHGDLDLSTPLENAQELLEYLPNGHLIRVGGGTHGAVGEIAREDPDFVDHLLDFMNADFETTKPVTLYQRMPKSVDLPPLKFLPTDGPTMFEQRWGRRKDAAAD